MIIPAMPNEESIARMNVRTKRLSGKRLESVLTVKNRLLSILHLLLSVVLGNAGLPDQKQKHGRHVKELFDSVFSVARSFIEDLMKLRNLAGSFVLDSVRSILRKPENMKTLVFMVLVRGIRQGRESLKGINRLVSSVVLPERGWLSIIVSLKKMVEPKEMIISLPCAGIATWLNTGIWNAQVNSLNLDFHKRIKATFREICGGFLFNWRIDVGWHNAHLFPAVRSS